MDHVQTVRWLPRRLPGVEVVAEHPEPHADRRVRLDGGYGIKITPGGAPPPVHHRGRVHGEAGSGLVTVVEPDEVVSSAGGGPDAHPLTRILVVDASLLPAGGRADRSRFRELRYRDHDLFDDIAALHGLLAEDDDALTLQSALTGVLDRLVTRHAVSSHPSGAPPRHRALREVRPSARSAGRSAGRQIGLDELASVAGCGKHHLIRSFQHAYGVPPHRYRNLVRLARAKEMPAAGKSVAEVAGELGFFDQSHLNRHFRQPFGMSAGAFAKAVR